ncbi:hypothetical protein BX600DRAFT_214756 [Xylariales sp. PMI_506]|nr:hypothetical protein BX600DRAFT_214756 [Xylariales sp. PMI_506]
MSFHFRVTLLVTTNFFFEPRLATKNTEAQSKHRQKSHTLPCAQCCIPMRLGWQPNQSMPLLGGEHKHRGSCRIRVLPRLFSPHSEISERFPGSPAATVPLQPCHTLPRKSRTRSVLLARERRKHFFTWIVIIWIIVDGISLKTLGVLHIIWDAMTLARVL